MLVALALSLALADPEPPAAASPIPRGERAVAWARGKLGQPYRWEGRGTQKLPGWDCLGILFRAYGTVDGRSWWTYEVNPSELVSGGKLGAPVEGVSAVLREELDVGRLRTGDVLYFLWKDYAIRDAPLWIHDGAQYRPWHTGLYVGEGRVLHARPGAEVMEEPLDAVSFDALFATRP